MEYAPAGDIAAAAYAAARPAETKFETPTVDAFSAKFLATAKEPSALLLDAKESRFSTFSPRKHVV